MSRPTALSSGALTGASTVVSNGKNLLNSVIVTTDGAAAATVTVFDNRAASGLILATIQCAGTDLSKSIVFNNAVRADIGLCVAVTGAGATGYISYAAA